MKEKAKTLRQNMPEAEHRMWYFLRDRRLGGYKFLRECVIDQYIVDFICRDKKLIIEIDGSQHMDNVEYDTVRTDYLMSKGYQVLRFWNNEVFEQIMDVLENILSFLEGRTPHPSLRDTFSPEGRRDQD